MPRGGNGAVSSPDQRVEWRDALGRLGAPGDSAGSRPCESMIRGNARNHLSMRLLCSYFYVHRSTLRSRSGESVIHSMESGALLTRSSALELDAAGLLLAGPCPSQKIAVRAESRHTPADVAIATGALRR